MNHQENGLDTVTLQLFSQGIFDILRTYSGWWLPKLSQNTKYFSKDGNIIENIATIDIISMSLL